MSSIRLKLEQYIDGTVNAPAVAEVLNADLEQVGRVQLSANRMTALDVDPGHYLVRARLPSGETLRRSVSLPDLESSAEVVFSGSPSPHEWLSWQHFLGYLASKPGPVAEEILATTWLRLWSFHDSAWHPERWLGEPFLGDQTALVTKITLSEGRVWLLQVGGERVPHRFIALPPAPRDIQILIRGTTRNTVRNGGVAVRIATFDAELEALVRYQALGAVESAAELGYSVADRAEEYARGKVENPNGAALGFYYLLSRQDYDRLHDWPRNFANWFPWLPDSSIIYAMQLLADPNATSTASAKMALSRASLTGVPVYARGLRYLYDQLVAYKTDRETPRDKDIDDALARTQAYVAATDWNEPRTTFFGARPESPNPELVFGIPQANDLLFLQRSKMLDSPVESSPVFVTPPREDQLVKQAQEGNPAALEQLHSLYSRQVLGFMRARSRRPADADDLAQQTWLMIVEKIRDYDVARGSFLGFLKYWGGISQLRWYDARKDASQSAVLFSELNRTHPEVRDEQIVDSIAQKLGHFSQPLQGQRLEIDEQYSDLLRRTFWSASPPHQLLTFGFCKLLGWAPRRFIEELSDESLFALEVLFEKEYDREAPRRGDLVRNTLARLREDLHKPFSEAAKDPTTLSTYPELLTQTVGQTRPRDYFRGRPEQNISHWTYAVRRRVVSNMTK